MKIHQSLILRGRVQGVGFRYKAKQLADALDIRGYARNLRDGSVVVELEGEQEKINKFINWCKSGQDLAVIEELETTEGRIQGFREFQVY